jgi:hypothetical protein
LAQRTRPTNFGQRRDGAEGKRRRGTALTIASIPVRIAGDRRRHDSITSMSSGHSSAGNGVENLLPVGDEIAGFSEEFEGFG